MGNSTSEYRFFDRIRETMDWEKRTVDLERRFLKTVQHAHQHSNAYREIFTSAGIEPSDIRGLEDL